MNLDFIEPFLVDKSLISWDENPKTDAGKSVKDILVKLRDDPASVTPQNVHNAVWANGSQIGNKEAYFGHVSDVAGIYEQVVNELLSKDSTLNLPAPSIARSRGLIHDLDSIVARYGRGFRGYKFAQHEKQLIEYFLFKGLGLEALAQEVPMHCGYFEILKMIAAGEGFLEIALYEDWTRVLNDPKNPLNFKNISAEFADFLQGRGNFPLIALAVSDYLDNGKSSFDLATIDVGFTARRDNILNRYYYNRIKEQKEPAALGKALVELGGIDRINNYFRIVNDLLNGETRGYKEINPGLYRK